MKLSVMEAIAHKGLDKVESWSRQGAVSPKDISEHCYISAASTANMQLPPGPSYDKKLLDALYKDARWLIRTYASSVNEAVDDVSQVDHQAVLHRSSEALLTIANLSDTSKRAFTDDVEEAMKNGAQPLDIHFDGGEVHDVDWSHESDYVYKMAANSTRACPALRAKSSFNPEVTMIEHFFGRYVDVMADRTIAHHLQQPIGEVTLMTFGR